MTQEPLPDVSSEQVITRYNELIREEDELNRKHELREEEELRALEDAKREIEAATKEERETLVKGLPADMPLPESFDRFLLQKRDDQIQKRQAEYEAKKVERKKLHDFEKLKHAEKWKTVLFSTQTSPIVSAPNLDLTVPQPMKPIEITLPPSVHLPRPVDVMRVLQQQREGPLHVVKPQPHQYVGIVVPQLLPRPPVVLSQSTVGQARLPPNNLHPHHGVNQQPRPVEAQRVPYPPQPQPRLAEQPMTAKPRTSLPETGRMSEGRPENPRGSPQGSFTLPRILPLGEQQRPPHTENEQFKRKAEGHPVPAQTEKRPRVQETKSKDSTSTELPGLQRGQKSITFDEVYQNGSPQFKHVIVEYPMNSRKYYILKCEEHGVHFNQNPLAGAAKHLHSAQHGNMSKERAQAVELLGYHIFDCDDVKMRQNNAMVMDAFSKGYKPLNLNQLTKAERASLNLPGDTSPTGTPPKAATANTSHRSSTRDAGQGFVHERPLGGLPTHQKLFTGITHPVPGELYLGYWANEKRNYAVLMLPFGDLKPAGMQGTLESTGLLEPSRVPKCYVYDNTTKIWGWAPGYDNGGQYVIKREFPVLYFDGRNSVGWLRAKDLSSFNFDDPLWREIPYFKDAVNYYAKIKGYPGFQEMRESKAGKDGRFFGRNQHGIQHGTFSTSRPPTAPLPPTTLPSQSGLIDEVRVNADARKSDSTMVSPADEVDMADASPVSDRDSYQDSINKGLDSDNDIDMANTESRRTSVSNRGDNQPEQGAPEQVLKQPFAQPVPQTVCPPRPVDMVRQYADRPAGGVYEMPPVNAPAVQMPPNAIPQPDGPPQRATPNPQAGISRSPSEAAQFIVSRSPSEFAQLIASKALHLQSPERDQPTVGTPAQHHGDLGRPGSQPDSLSSNGHGYRRVEKIHARNSNPYRNSPTQSPSMSTTILPDPRLENGSSQASVSRNSSPASLHNILQNPSPQPHPVMARPGPLSQNGPASLQPHQARHSSLTARPPPLDQNGVRTTSPPMRSPSVLASFSQASRIPPSPPHPSGLGIQQPSRSPVTEHQGQARTANSPAASVTSHPPTRTPTPVILKSNSELLGDRWRAVRAESTSQSESSTALTTVRAPSLSHEQRQPAPVPTSTSPRLTAGSPREPALITPVGSSSDTRSNSPAQLKESRTSPAPFVKTESGTQPEYFDLACISCNKEVIFDHSRTGGQLLRFLADTQAKVVSATPDAGTQVAIDPHMVKEAVFQTSNVSPTASTVLLKMNDGKELELVFEVSGLSSGRVHAKRFLRWIKSVNHGIEHKQNSSASSMPAIITLE